MCYVCARVCVHCVCICVRACVCVCCECVRVCVRGQNRLSGFLGAGVAGYCENSGPNSGSTHFPLTAEPSLLSQMLTSLTSVQGLVSLGAFCTW